MELYNVRIEIYPRLDDEMHINTSLYRKIIFICLLYYETVHSFESRVRCRGWKKEVNLRGLAECWTSSSIFKSCRRSKFPSRWEKIGWKMGVIKWQRKRKRLVLLKKSTQQYLYINIRDQRVYNYDRKKQKKMDKIKQLLKDKSNILTFIRRLK